MKFTTLKTGLPALFFALSLGVAQAQPEGLPGAPAQAQVSAAAMADGQAQAFVDWAIENPERLQATLNQMGIQADLTQILAEIQAPGAAVAGSYQLRHYGEYGTVTKLEVTAGLAVTRTRIGDKGHVLSQLSGKADLVGPNKIKVTFGPEEVKARGAARAVGRVFKSGLRGVRQGLNIRDAVYTINGGRIKGRFLTTPERGFRVDQIKELAGTYKLYCANLTVSATELDDRFNVTRKGHDGTERFGKAKLEGSKLKVKFTDGTRGSYRFRIDNNRVFGTFYTNNRSSRPGSKINQRERIVDSGWRDGVTPEPNWLERQVTKVSTAVRELTAKIKAITLDLISRAQAMIARGWNRTKVLASIGWNKTKNFAQDSWATTKRVAKHGWDVTTDFLGDARDATVQFLKDVIFFVRCNLAALVGAVETGAGKLKDVIAPAPKEAAAR